MNKRIRKKKRKALNEAFKGAFIPLLARRMNDRGIVDYLRDRCTFDGRRLEAYMLPKVGNA